MLDIVWRRFGVGMEVFERSSEVQSGEPPPMRPAHEHFMISTDGYETLITHVFDREGEHLESDAFFGVRESLITTFEHHEPGEAPDGKLWTSLFTRSRTTSF
jgi:protocatechuate 3,4-dioxygenase beta subunit